MKTSECSQGREFGASWQFQGKICLWIWSDSNNNSQDHCETLRGNSWFFFSFFLPALLPRKASVWLKYHWQEASYLSRSAPEKARAGAAGAGCSARPGAGSGGDGHLCPAWSSGSQVWRQGLPTAPLWLGDSVFPLPCLPQAAWDNKGQGAFTSLGPKFPWWAQRASLLIFVNCPATQPLPWEGLQRGWSRPGCAHQPKGFGWYIPVSPN